MVGGGGEGGENFKIPLATAINIMQNAEASKEVTPPGPPSDGKFLAMPLPKTLLQSQIVIID